MYNVMKTMKSLLIAALSFSLLFMSCSKDKDETNPDNSTTQGNSLTCKVDGNAWTASLAVVATNSGGVLTVTGSDSNAGQCQITLMNVKGTGTYELGGSATNPNTGRWTQGLDPNNDTFTTMMGIGSGSVEITELTSSKVSGTFSFTAKNMNSQGVSITDGSFSSDFSN